MTARLHRYGPLLTDLYEFTMAYAYFAAGKHEDAAVFDLFFRKCPFGGEFTLFAGLSEVLRFIQDYRFSDEEADYVCSHMPNCRKDFRAWLQSVDCSQMKVYAISEGSLVFPRLPLIRVEGPLGVVQMLESALLNLVAFPSLVATNAARLRIAAGDRGKIVEFGLRRAQGPDGAISASQYSYLGGCEGTSNVLAAQMFGIPVSGTQAHAYISSFTSLDNLKIKMIADSNGTEVDFLSRVNHYRGVLDAEHTHDGELASFVAYAQAFPNDFLALVDTYDTLDSGIPNALVVSAALAELGHKPAGIRLDSGDLSHLSRKARDLFRDASEKTGQPLSGLTIVASNEINEPTLRSLRQQGHEVDVFGVGTHLVTCQAQPSLGCVYKLVEVNGVPRIKISQESIKTTIPGRKTAYRLYGRENKPLLDLLAPADEKPPEEGTRVLCCHPFEETKRAYVVPTRVQHLYDLVWDGELTGEIPSLQDARQHARDQLPMMREDHLRLLNPTPYKVSLSESLFSFTRDLWLKEAPVGELE